eukprot:TRINITY_DN0_c0_g1_i1.p1 TRINITY_DN0_c0_g1~~TRINITY_DN0_c0_g1_i1.p1  ORF type:complete len:336 (-),score=71.16 TRINITY_DN0_c0_g1_i1:113-1054(-)
MKLLIAFCLVALAIGQKLIADPALIAEVNKHATWKAGINEVFDGVELDEAPRFLGLLKRPSTYFELPIINKEIKSLPDSFDSRVNWQGRIIPVRDQASCGSCWAFGATEALSDRFNIKHAQDPLIMLSPQQLVSCDTTSSGCSGGYPDKAWTYMQNTGVVTDACYPYSSASGTTGTCLLTPPKAGQPCPKTGNGTQVLYHAANAGRLANNEQQIMQDIVDYGSIEMGFHVYQDFFNYKSGVYYHQSGGLAGGHAIKVLGYGYDQTSKLKYWIAANSWGTSWGLQGYFWIKKGTDECGIESWFTVSGQAGNIDK